MIYIIIIIIVIIGLNIIKSISQSTKDNKEKLRIYECGFNEFEEPREKFYIKFYIIAILFLIFDLETIILYPLSIYISTITSINYILIFYYFIILSIGLAIEIINKILD